MILGLGLDVVEAERMARALSGRTRRFEKCVFTEAELAECSGRVDRVRALAARFAAKEACMKALGVGLGDGVSFQDVEVVRSEEGRPVLRLRGYAEARAESLGARSVHVSLTHGLATAAAVAVLEG